MQNNIVMAFRKRLKKRGYLNISIYLSDDKVTYDISAVEPLSKVKVTTNYSLVAMHCSFR